MLGLATKELPLDARAIYHPNEESNLTFMGFLVFLDPPKATASEAIKVINDLKPELLFQGF